MSRLVGDVIRVECDDQQQPILIVWHGVRYPVAQVIDDYCYQLSWWQGRTRQINRDYYLLRTQLQAVVLIYHRRDSDTWILESVLD